jgi:Ca-activated chloride channel family protein
LIDRSNSVQYDRLVATKAAVFQSIEELREGDLFNIIAFDNKIQKLSPTLTRMAPNILAKTTEFLSKIQLGSFFTPSDLYKSLFTTIPTCPKDDEIYTAILLTDGESLAKRPMQEAFMRDWTLQNGGRVSLYALSMENDAHLATLDAACHFNYGRLIYTNSHRGLKRKLLKLTKNIKYPIAKNITLKAIAKSSHANIEICPMPSPALYLDQPYVLLGSTETPDDFVLFIQGKLKDQWLNIKKTISFVNAKKAGNSLQSEWALQKAYQQYEKYICEGDYKYLAEAKLLLKPFNLQVAFQ